MSLCQVCQRADDQHIVFFNKQERVICEYCLYDEQPSLIVVELEKLTKKADPNERYRRLNLLTYYQKMVEKVPPGPFQDFYRADLARFLATDKEPIEPDAQTTDKIPHENHKRYYCEACNYTTDKTSSFKAHVKTKRHQKKAHNIIFKKAPKPRKIFTCDKCNRGFSRKANMERHQTVCKAVQIKNNDDQILISAQNQDHQIDLFKQYQPQEFEGTAKQWIDFLNQIHQRLTSKHYQSLSHKEQQQLSQYIVNLFYNLSPEGFKMLINSQLDIKQKNAVTERLNELLSIFYDQIKASADPHWDLLKAEFSI